MKVGLGWALATALAFAATPASAKPAKKAAGHASPARKAPAPAAQATQARERTPTPAPAPAPAADSETAGDDAPAKPAAGGGKVKTKAYTFGAMDVEGKLKTPQLLYFLNRVKLELDMSAPDKRSFMKELQQSADDKNL